MTQDASSTTKETSDFEAQREAIAAAHNPPRPTGHQVRELLFDADLMEQARRNSWPAMDKDIERVLRGVADALDGIGPL